MYTFFFIVEYEQLHQIKSVLQLYKQMNQNPANSQNPPNAQNPQQVVQPPKKKARQTITLKAEHFEKQNGIQALYKAIQNTNFTRGQDNVEISMKKITALLKTWHYQMLQKYSFDLFLQRCRVLGNHKFTQAYMAKVRKIHKGEETWLSDQNNEQDGLNNINLQHLNPNLQQTNQPNRAESLAEKMQQANKLINEIQKRQNIFLPESRKMEIDQDERNKMQAQMDEDEDDGLSDCEQLFKQMDALEKEKKELLGIGKQQQKPAQRQQNKPNLNQDIEEMPYVPEGFDDVDFEQESSDNN